MTAVNDFANAAAAVAGGFAKTQVDRTATPGGPNDKNPAPRFLTRFEKYVVGAVGDGGHLIVAEGESSASAAAADTQAVAALNRQLSHYYGGSPGRASGAGDSSSGRGGGHTVGTS
jgi:hypothetical protein